MKHKLVYSPKYDLLSRGVSFLHPFDGRKYSRAWDELGKISDVDIGAIWQSPEQPITDEALLRVHTPDYLQSLSDSRKIADIIEVPLARFIPNKLLQSKLIEPMKYATEGTCLATRIALEESAMVMNFGGGFHHAYADHGEGFCVFADAALAIANSRENGQLARQDKIVMIDLDAHRGNGFESIFRHDAAVSIYDMYNFQVYPGMHEGNPDDYPFMIPLKNKASDEFYLKALKEELPRFLADTGKPELAFYNAGSDILARDPLGNLNVTHQGVIERDRFVVQALAQLNVPTVIVTSGGYTSESYKLIAHLASTMLDNASH